MLPAFLNIIVEWIWPIAQFIIGLGAVVFVHELGHFLVAKKVGIQIDRFALGFGPRLIGFKRGETEYCLCAIPLGGYVAMVGQEDFKPNEDTANPRAFCNKSVGARMAVISAGVIMNLIMAAIIFIIIGMTGKDFVAPVVGGADAGFPVESAVVTWQGQPAGHPETTEGLKAGDRVIKIEGDSILLKLIDNKITSFQDLAMTGLLADIDETYKFTIERMIDRTPVIGTADIGVKINKQAGAPLFGIRSPVNTVLLKPQSTLSQTPFQANDRVLAVAGQAVSGGWNPAIPIDGLTTQPVNVTVRRDGQEIDIALQPLISGGNGQDVIWEGAERTYGQVIAEDETTITLKTADGSESQFDKTEAVAGPAELLDILGMIPRIKIGTVQVGSPADNAGLKPGDIIIGFGDRGAPTYRQLLDITAEAPVTGANIVVTRDGKMADAMRVYPKRKKGRALIGISPTVDDDSLIIAGIRPDSPAANAGMAAGMTVTAVNGSYVNTWPELFDALSANQDKPVTLTCRIGQSKQDFKFGSLTEENFDPASYVFSLSYGLPFDLLMVRIKSDNVFAAVKWGGRETLKMVLSTYVSLRSLVIGNVDTKSLMGPLGIGQIAVQASREFLTDFIYFMGFFSTAIAVFNFLPLPVLDGGHALFLIIEKLRGKPISPKVMNAIQMTGLVLIGMLFLAITAQDILRMLGLT